MTARASRSLGQQVQHTLMRWVDSWAAADDMRDAPHPERIDWLRVMPFVAAHLACLLVFVVGWSPVAVLVALGLYLIRMFFITAFYHRYFSHRSFRASRPVQLGIAIAGATCMQRGPLWWAAHHRKHHAHSDEPADVHSPVQHGFFWSHVGWLMTRANFPTDLKVVKDLARFPELRFLDRFDTLVPLVLAGALFGTGEALERWAPGLGTTGPQMLVWGFFISTIALLHAAVTINSLAHGRGARPYPTRDSSRNSFPLALLTFGEGWHNNHHWFPSSARMGFHWWQVDFSYYGLWTMSKLGLITDLVPVPAHALSPREADAA